MQVLRVDQYLRHEAYGLGVVTSSTTDRTTIDFEDHGIKKFVTNLMKVELLPGQSPNRHRTLKVAAKKLATRRLPKS